jgi:hypothetical protein
MAIDVSGSNEAKNLVAWIGSAMTVFTVYFGLEKFRRGGPMKELGVRVDNIEKNVNDKFDQLTAQRVLDVSSLKSEFASHSVKLAELTTALNAQTKAFDTLVSRFDNQK